MSRLLIVERSTGRLTSEQFSNLPNLLTPGDLLVANSSRVIPARLQGTLPTGGRIELLLIRDRQDETWEVMARPARKLRVGTLVSLPGRATASVESVQEDGRRIVRFSTPKGFDQWLVSAGKLPIPPYIHSYPRDPERYQTVYSRIPGSVAAPTAGLHFTPALLETLQSAGIAIEYVTLHVGPGTFAPVTSEDLSQVRLHSEWGTISAETAQAVSRAKSDGNRVVAVGTTTTRLLEGMVAAGEGIREWEGEVDLFVRPPFEFQVVDALITNFHLPKSSLLMLVSAFAGRDLIRRAYEHAIEQRYRFYSFGDAMLIL